MKVTESMGFTEDEAKKMLLKCPLVFKQKFEDQLQANFDLLHAEVLKIVLFSKV
jgi:hypothetical protein